MKGYHDDLCVCGHTPFAHVRHGCLHCSCMGLEVQSEVQFTPEEKQEWTQIVKRVGGQISKRKTRK